VIQHVSVIPVFNEASTIGSLVARVACHGPVLVVDDGSSDGSAGAAAAAGAAVIHTGHRRGKGAALRAGFTEALRRGAERVLTLDGDGQHDPEDVPRLLAASAAFPRAIVIGSRSLDTQNDEYPNTQYAHNGFDLRDDGLRRADDHLHVLLTPQQRGVQLAANLSVVDRRGI